MQSAVEVARRKDEVVVSREHRSDPVRADIRVGARGDPQTISV